MDDITDDQWVRAMLDAEVPQEELRAGFEDALRGELRRAWRRSPALPEAERARRRRRFLLAACAAAVVLVVTAVVVLRPDHKSSIYSPPVTTDATTTSPSTTPTTTPDTQAADSTTSAPASSVPDDTVPPPSVPQSESSVLMKLDNGAPRLGATRVVAGLDLSAYSNVSAIIAPDGRIVAARDVDGKRVLATVSADGTTLDDIGISLELDSEFLFGAHGDLYTFQRPAKGDARISEYKPADSGNWSWFASSAGAVSTDCHLERRPDGASCGEEMRLGSGSPDPFDRVSADASLGTADAAATITRTGGAVEHVWTTQLQMQRSLACDDAACTTPLYPGPADSVVWTPPADGGQPDRAVFVLDDRDTAGAAWLDPSIESVVGVQGDELIAIRHQYQARTLVAIDLSSILDPALATTPVANGPVDSGGPGFIPACGETVSANVGDVLAGDSALETFGPLGAAPSIDVELPLSRSEISTVVLEPDASALAIPGGMLIAVVPSSYGYFAGSMLAAIDSDGSVRWIRCFSDAADGVYAAPTETNPSSAYVLFAKDAPDHSELPTFRIDRLSLADGAVTGTVADMAAAQGVHLDPAVTWRPVAQSATSLLFGPASAAGTTPDLVRFDVATGVATDVPYPPSTGANRYFGFDDDGDVVLLAENNTTSFNSIFLDGEWVTDDAAVAAAGAQAVRVDFALDPSDSALHGYDATGKVLWSQPAIVSTNGEGFRAATSNGVTLVRGCTSYDFETGAGCKGAGLWGVDPLTGNVTWHLDGRRQVSAVADGFALVTEPIAEDGTGGAWIMIDVTTGEPVDESQRWVDPSTFDSQCCGGGESVYVKAEGGIVFAANGDHVAVWYPKAASIPTVTVTLP